MAKESKTLKPNKWPIGRPKDHNLAITVDFLDSLESLGLDVDNAFDDVLRYTVNREWPLWAN